MDAFVSPLSNGDIADIAAYYASLKCRSKSTTVATQAPRKATRCRICHGKTGLSRKRTMPNLAGQDETYLREQLTAYRAAALNVVDATYVRESKIMEPQARSLSDTDISELAAFYAQQSCSK